MTNPPFRLGYIAELDGLRGVAITAVMIFHASSTSLIGGFIGVDIFFVLSGFLITALLVGEYNDNKTIKIKDFYIRRILRLAPALLLLLLVFLLVSFVFLDLEKIISNVIDALIVFFYGANWARAFNIHPPDYLGHTWSLSIEEQFYIIFPALLYWLLRKIKSSWNIVFIILFLALSAWMLRIYFATHGASVPRLYNGLDTRADALLIGCVVGVIVASNLIKADWKEKMIASLQFMSPISALLLLYVTFTVHWENMSLYYWLFFFIEVLAAIIILDVVLNPRSSIKRVLALQPLVWVGRISYGLYLWHYPIYRTLYALDYSQSVIIILGTLMTFLVATLSYSMLEQPFLRLKKKRRTPLHSQMLAN